MGRDNEFSHLSLSQAERVGLTTQPGKNRGRDSQHVPAKETTAQASTSSQAQASINLQHLPRLAPSHAATSEPIVSPEHAQVQPKVRLYTSEERMWNAVAGHGPDLQRIPKMEFQCLSIITSRQSKGILQADVTRITGQDKRSIPKRTQNLHDHGYIEKKPILFNGMKTSWLYAKRFAPKPASLNTRICATQTEESTYTAPEHSEGDVVESRMPSSA